MTDLTPLLDGSRTPGVYPVDGEPAELRVALDRAGWSTAVLGPVRTVDDFYDEVAAALDLPEYFGRNLDALWDCLTDLDRATAVIIVGWTHLAQAQPSRWAAIRAVLVERCSRTPAFAVVLV